MSVTNMNPTATETAAPPKAAALPIKPETDTLRYVSPHVAHELNNIFTVIQGYADRLLYKHAGDPELQPHLKMIADASRRAVSVVREATPRPSLKVPPRAGAPAISPS
jgi:hypothetical protein